MKKKEISKFTIQLNLNGKTIRLTCWGKRVKSILFPPRIGVSSKLYVHAWLLNDDWWLILSILGFWLRKQKRINVLHGWIHVKKLDSPLQHVPLIFKPFRLTKRSNSISNLPEHKHNYLTK